MSVARIRAAATSGFNAAEKSNLSDAYEYDGRQSAVRIAFCGLRDRAARHEPENIVRFADDTHLVRLRKEPG
jgi:hypothetical protein